MTDAETVLGLRHMEIGDLVIYDGKSYVLRGLEPMSVPDRRAELVDAETGDVVLVPLADLAESGATRSGLSQSR